MTEAVAWADFVGIVRRLSAREEGPPVSGTFVVETEVDLRLLKACLGAKHDVRMTLVDDADASSLKVGDSVRLSASPRFGFGLLTNDVGSLLSGSRKSRFDEPNFFLMRDGISSDDPPDDESLVGRYRLVLKFIQVLKRAAAFLDDNVPSLVFISDGKFEVPLEYDAECLRRLPVSVLRDLLGALPTGTHEKQCKAILADAVVSLSGHLASGRRFEHLLDNASDLKKRYDQGYDLFAAGFSYDKVRDQVEAARVEYSAKIHKVFSDIQNQLLSIPVATIVVGSQMKDATKVGYEFWVNTAVLVGCWVFAVLMIFLLHNQSQTLSVLGDEIARQKRQLTKEFAAVAGSFDDTFAYLRKRARVQRIILWTIDGFVVVGLILSHVVYLKLTLPARDWAVVHWPYLQTWF